MANTVNNTLTALASTTGNNALPGSADFWSEHVHKNLNNGLFVGDTRGSLLDDYPELTDDLYTDFTNWYHTHFNDQADPINVTIELLCDYPAPRHCKKYLILDDDWIGETARFQDLIDHIYAALTHPYDTPDDFDEQDQVDKFTQGQDKALSLLNQQLSTSGGRFSAKLYSMKMARTIICANKNGPSNEFTAAFDAKGNKATNRESRYQQIKCSIRAQKVCNAVSANKLLALDVATGKILHKIARDPDYELRNKSCHVKSNCARDKHLQAAQAARAAATDSADGGERGKKRRRGHKGVEAKLFTPNDAIDHVSNPGVEDEGHNFPNHDYEGELNDNEEPYNPRTTTMPVRELAVPRPKLRTHTALAGMTSLPANAGAAISNIESQTPTNAPFGQYPIDPTQLSFHPTYLSVDSQNSNNATITGYPAASHVARMAQMQITQPQYPQYSPYPTNSTDAPFATSFGNPQVQMGAARPHMSVYQFGFTAPPTPRFRATSALPFDAAAPNFNFQYSNRGGVDNDDA
ncbi:hypothetical protein LTR86_001298 [Recurvomyces mirabilis]|nr:hypothetical protein LTR86_001298 [Recurvomyces mirabilis]